MTVWAVEDDDADNGSGECFYATKREAVEHARAVQASGCHTSVYRIKLARFPKLKLVLLLLSDRGFEAERTEVLSLAPKNEDEEPDEAEAVIKQRFCGG